MKNHAKVVNYRMKNIKLGIYGDSYGVKNENRYTSWVDIVAKQLGVPYNNYCKSASPLFYSYTQFLETNTQHDIVIFLVTLPYRYTKSITLDVTGKREHYISGIHNIEYLIKRHTNLTDADKKLLNSLKNWFWIMDEDFFKVAQKLIVDDIIARRPDTVIVPCFYESLTSDQYENFGLVGHDHFYHLTELQCRSLDLPMNRYHDYAENLDIMNGHLTPELNNIVGNLIYNRINNGTWSEFPTDLIEHEFTYEEYYKLL